MFSLFSSQCASNTHISQTLHNKWPPSNNHEVLLLYVCFSHIFLNSRLSSLKNAIIHLLSFS